MLRIAAIIPAPDNAEIIATMVNIKVRLFTSPPVFCNESKPHFEHRSQLSVELSFSKMRSGAMKAGSGGGGGKSGKFTRARLIPPRLGKQDLSVQSIFRSLRNISEKRQQFISFL